jgi:hypothetical protein
MARLGEKLGLAALIGVFTIGAVVRVAAADKPAKEVAGEEAEQDARLSAMRAIAEGIAVEAIEGDSTTKVGLLEGARFRFNTTTIGCDDGTVWVWGDKGRPSAVLTLSGEWHEANGGGVWSYELTSLSPKRLRATGPEGWRWTPVESGVEFQDVPNGPVAAETASRRLGQIKDIARRFGGFGIYGGNVGEPSQFRILPTPLHRYDDVAAGVIDGAMFVVAVDTNPEALLLVELVKGTPSATWKFGVNRVSSGEIHATLDDKEVWKSPPFGPLTPESRYYLLIKAMPK